MGQGCADLVDLLKPPRIMLIQPGDQVHFPGLEFRPYSIQVDTNVHLNEAVNDSVG